MSSVQISGSASGAGVLNIAAPSTATNRTLTLPDNTGTLISSATTTGINATALTTGTVPTARLPAGTVLQVVSTVKNDTFSSTSTTNTDITGLSVAITPTSTSSNILVLVQSNYGPGGGSQIANFQIVRNSTNIANPSNTGLLYSSTVTAYQITSDQTANYSISYLDSPATTSATTYKVQGRTTSGTWYVNRRNTADMNTISTITVMEIAA